MPVGASPNWRKEVASQATKILVTKSTTGEINWPHHNLHWHTQPPFINFSSWLLNLHCIYYTHNTRILIMANRVTPFCNTQSQPSNGSSNFYHRGNWKKRIFYFLFWGLQLNMVVKYVQHHVQQDCSVSLFSSPSAVTQNKFVMTPTYILPCRILTCRWGSA